MKKYIFLLFLTALSLNSLAQTITGVVKINGSETDTEPLAGAIVKWADKNGGVVTDKNGEFSIYMESEGSKELVASFVGFHSDTIRVDNQTEVVFSLVPTTLEVEQVIVKSRKSNSISAISPEKKELITFAGLCKMACCNLAESFENSASVTVGYSDAVSGARQIKLLGYSGTYTQMLDETRPIMRGLSSTYGLEYTPGMWLQGIQISKGVTSVVNGYEALTGQINIEHRKPTDDEPLFVNLFLSQDLRAESNITSSFNINDKLSTVILTHLSMDKMKMDDNGDGFLDMPLKEQYNVGNRWLYATEGGTQIRFGVRGLYEKRNGGQKDFEIGSDILTNKHYGSEIVNKDFNGFLKVGIPLVKNKLYEEEEGYEDETTSNIALVADYVYHEQDAFFGLKDYYGNQNSYYANLLYQVNYGQKHQFITGTTFTADVYEENLMDRYDVDITDLGSVRGFEEREYILDRELITAGIFGEYTFKVVDKFDLIAGIRADHNNKYGWMYTPRGHLKWNITPTTTARASAGVGYRIMSLIADNIGMLATGREINIADDINPLERGFTAGGSLTQTFNLGQDPAASISVDYFRSQFTDQVIVDQETNAYQIMFYNLDGRSLTDTYQIDFSYAPFERFNLFATYRYNDTEVTLKNNMSVVTPLVNKFKGLVNLQYATKFDRWTFDFTAQINGQSRLPVQDGMLTSTADYSPVYPMFYGQVTHRVRKIDYYIGCENIGNYTQSIPIISADNPFDSTFNSTSIWGPIMGRKFYVGIRYTM
ncbi:MAG: TonB-dependent receptor [Rikenellaceae bacterium]